MENILQNQNFQIKLSQLLKNDWYTIGSFLRVPDKTLVSIRNDYVNFSNAEAKANEMIKTWINIDNHATFDKLKDSIKEIPKYDLLKEVEALKASLQTRELSKSIQPVNTSLVPKTRDTMDSDEKVKIEELSIDRDNFNLKKVREISLCAFGKVYLCKDERTDRSLAMKCIETGNIDHNVKAKQEVENFRHEISLFQSLNHERIVKYFCTTYTSTTISIIMEFMEGGSLFDKISNEGALDEKTASEKSYQILCGLDYLHNKNIVHRDIKSANILLDLYGNCKLADFGISKQIQTIRSHAGCKSSVGTCYWMSPEVINPTFPNFEYGKKADIWSFGCTVLEMLTTKPPWSHLSYTAAIFHIGTHPTIPHLPDSSSSSCKTFVNDCFQRDPKLRPNALQLLSYDWIKDVHKKKFAIK